MSTLVGALGSPTAALVDERGVIAPRGSRTELSLLVSHDEDWHDPRTDPTLRWQLRDAAPVVETRMRVGGGDVTQRVFGVADGAGPVVVELENQSAAAVAVALVATPTARRARVLRTDDRRVSLDGDVHVWTVSPSRRWLAAATGNELRAGVEAGQAISGPPEVGAGGSRHLALLFAVPHGITWRAAIVRGHRSKEALDPRELPGAESVVRGWASALDRGLRVELPDRVIAHAVEAARAQAVVASQFTGRGDAELVMVLEDWGLDAEAAHVWSGLSFAARRRARRRRGVASGPWNRVRNLAASPAADATALLGAVRDVLIDATRDDEVLLVPGFPAEWLGAELAVHEAPTRKGPASFALRWHGARPALLWEAPCGLQLRAPVLDPEWRSGGRSGEALLSAPTPALLQMRTSNGEEGSRVADPGSFT